MLIKYLKWENAIDLSKFEIVVNNCNRHLNLITFITLNNVLCNERDKFTVWTRIVVLQAINKRWWGRSQRLITKHQTSYMLTVYRFRVWSDEYLQDYSCNWTEQRKARKWTLKREFNEQCGHSQLLSIHIKCFLPGSAFPTETNDVVSTELIKLGSRRTYCSRPYLKI